MDEVVFAPCLPLLLETESTSSLSSGARSRDPFALPIGRGGRDRDVMAELAGLRRERHEAFHRLILSSHNTSSCHRVWPTAAIIVVRRRMPAAVPTAGRAQLAGVGLFAPRRGRPRTVAASPCRPG